jgi:hypothetical protein
LSLRLTDHSMDASVGIGFASGMAWTWCSRRSVPK